jgi:hypothetical protein
MITMLDMETGAILERGARPEPQAVGTLPELSPMTLMALVELPEVGTQQRRTLPMPPDLALLDIAEVLARFH